MLTTRLSVGIPELLRKRCIAGPMVDWNIDSGSFRDKSSMYIACKLPNNKYFIGFWLTPSNMKQACLFEF